MSLTTNIQEKANLIWAIANKLTGVYKPHEYGEVIKAMVCIGSSNHKILINISK